MQDTLFNNWLDIGRAVLLEMDVMNRTNRTKELNNARAVYIDGSSLKSIPLQRLPNSPTYLSFPNCTCLDVHLGPFL
jgi:hypothetical protein